MDDFFAVLAFLGASLAMSSVLIGLAAALGFVIHMVS